jgi:ribulose-5-phosphate 4-epimerase/fuculose-1-phosphate aldolase
VARTWGNVSARVDGSHFLITPSGLSYTKTKPEDLALFDMENGTFEGKYKPSSEKGVHAGAYARFPEAGFVIHTHQNFASAFSVAGFSELMITDDEREKLGGIALASYGLPGTGTLKKAVNSCYEKGAHTVLMSCHGAVIVGKDKDEALERVRLLEEICKRSYKGHDFKESAAVAFSRLEVPLKAQLDDMAQMIGKEIPVAGGNAPVLLEKCPAVIVPGKGILVKGRDDDDTKALEILSEKAAITALHCRSIGASAKLPWLDVAIMNYVYKSKYSKKKEG